MSLKLEKIAAEREKARRKRDEWEERRKEWDRKYHEQENSEICEMVHAQSLTPEQLAVIIQYRCAGSGCSRKRKCRENGQYRQHRNRPGYAGAAGWL